MKDIVEKPMYSECFHSFTDFLLHSVSTVSLIFFSKKINHEFKKKKLSLW